MRSSGKFLNFTSSSYNELAAVVYADIFGYPLTVSEAKLWAIRKERENYSVQKFDQATEITNFLKLIPTIEAIFLTGSVAAKNAKKNADVDLMIITSSNTAWLTRAIIFFILKLSGKLKTPICPNIFLDLNHLEIKNKNLYTAHEVLQAKCLFDRGNVVYRWLKNNEWTEKYLPKVYRLSLRGAGATKQSSYDESRLPRQSLRSFLAMTLLAFPELIVFIAQYLYQKPKQTNEKLGWGYAFFHPNELSGKVLRKFEQRLLKYKGE